jgi:hypothetical protein
VIEVTREATRAPSRWRTPLSPEPTEEGDKIVSRDTSYSIDGSIFIAGD